MGKGNRRQVGRDEGRMCVRHTLRTADLGGNIQLSET